MIVVDDYSLVPLPLEALFNETRLSAATGFWWRHATGPFFITNWHVVTGKHPDTGKHLADHAGEPNKLRIYATPAGKLGEKRGLDVALHNKDGRPGWLVHPKYREKVDIAVIPVNALADLHIQAINAMPAVPAKQVVGADVFVLGYPLGAAAMPIWKRASIATEPDIGGPDEPLLIDTATRPGMSGSPVIWRGTQYFDEVSSVWVVGSEAASRFIGVYSGRVAAKDTLEAQLGRVWRASLIEEIITANCRDKD